MLTCTLNLRAPSCYRVRAASCRQCSLRFPASPILVIFAPVLGHLMHSGGQVPRQSYWEELCSFLCMLAISQSSGKSSISSKTTTVPFLVDNNFSLDFSPDKSDNQGCWIRTVLTQGPKVRISPRPLVQTPSEQSWQDNTMAGKCASSATSREFCHQLAKGGGLSHCGWGNQKQELVIHWAGTILSNINATQRPAMSQHTLNS